MPLRPRSNLEAIRGGYRALNDFEKLLDNANRGYGER